MRKDTVRRDWDGERNSDKREGSYLTMSQVNGKQRELQTLIDTHCYLLLLQPNFAYAEQPWV